PGAAGDVGIEKILWRQALRHDYSAKYTAGGSAQSRTSGPALRSAVEGGGELHSASQRDHRALFAGRGFSAGDEQDGLVHRLSSMYYIDYCRCTMRTWSLGRIAEL